MALSRNPKLLGRGLVMPTSIRAPVLQGTVGLTGGSQQPTEMKKEAVCCSQQMPPNVLWIPPYLHTDC